MRDPHRRSTTRPSTIQTTWFIRPRVFRRPLDARHRCRYRDAWPRVDRSSSMRARLIDQNPLEMNRSGYRSHDHLFQAIARRRRRIRLNCASYKWVKLGTSPNQELGTHRYRHTASERRGRCLSPPATIDGALIESTTQTNWHEGQ